MLKWLRILIAALRSALHTRRDLALENLALRQQLAVYKETQPRPRLTDADRQFWVLLSRIWSGWRATLHIVQPDTVVRWHRQGFRRYWRWKSRKRGRPAIDPETIQLIRRMCRANPLWGAPRIHGELLKLGIDICETTVAKYMIKRRGSPSQAWKTFLENHLQETIALDFFTVPNGGATNNSQFMGQQGGNTPVTFSPFQQERLTGYIEIQDIAAEVDNATSQSTMRDRPIGRAGTYVDRANRYILVSQFISWRSWLDRSAARSQCRHEPIFAIWCWRHTWSWSRGLARYNGQ